VQANDGFCRDKVALRKDVKSQGKAGGNPAQLCHRWQLQQQAEGSPKVHAGVCPNNTAPGILQSFKVTFLAAQGAAKVVEVPDDEYILDAAGACLGSQ
jgi:hypothetical protein